MNTIIPDSHCCNCFKENPRYKLKWSEVDTDKRGKVVASSTVILPLCLVCRARSYLRTIMMAISGIIIIVVMGAIALESTNLITGGQALGSGPTGSEASIKKGLAICLALVVFVFGSYLPARIANKIFKSIFDPIEESPYRIDFKNSDFQRLFEASKRNAGLK